MRGYHRENQEVAGMAVVANIHNRAFEYKDVLSLLLCTTYQGEKFDMGVPGGDAISERIDKQEESDNEKLFERLTMGHDILKVFHFQKLL